MKKIIKIQFFILLIGTVFTLTNFANVLFIWFNNQDCENGCLPPGELVNPFLTVEFYSALFFILALILNLFLLVGSRTKKSQTEEKNMAEDQVTEPRIELP